MSLLEIVLLAVAGFAAGVVNAVAGGGTFLTFPVMVGYGMPSINANATSSVALLPGSAAVAAGYRHETAKHWREMVPFVGIGIVGGAIGSLILITIGDEGFRPLVPWLMGTATLLFAFSARITAFASRHARDRDGVARIIAYGVMAVVGVYGGFFGAGMGIVLLAALAIIMPGDYHKQNAVKNMVATTSTAVGIALFIATGLVWWPQALITTATAILGGHMGVGFARKLPDKAIRATVMTIGVVLTLYFFWKG